MTLGRIWLSPIAVRHNPELGPNMGPPNVSSFPVAPAELGRTDPRRTRTCRSGLHAAAARAAGLCRGPRSAAAARSLGTVEGLANVFMRSLGEGRSESLLILPSFTAPVRRTGATARCARSNLKAVIRRPDHPGDRRAGPDVSSPHSENNRRTFRCRSRRDRPPRLLLAPRQGADPQNNIAFPVAAAGLSGPAWPPANIPASLRDADRGDEPNDRLRHRPRRPVVGI